MLDRFRCTGRLPSLLLTALMAGMVVLAVCGGGGDDVEAILERAEASTEEIVVGISMFVLVDDLENPDPAFSSRRPKMNWKRYSPG